MLNWNLSFPVFEELSVIDHQDRYYLMFGLHEYYKENDKSAYATPPYQNILQQIIVFIFVSVLTS